MTTINRIIPQQVNTSPEIDCVGLQIELERTPGAVAVSGMYGRELAGDKSPAGIPKTNSLNPPEQLSYQYPCGSLILFTSCKPDDHHFAKKILCGKEWCEICGEEGSKEHNRRIARLLPKYQQMSQIRYFVIEFPDRYRKLYDYAYSKKALQGVSKKIVDVMAGKRTGRRGRVGGYFSRGLLRWHWFGDEMVGKYNPHANVVVDGRFVSPSELERIKVSLRKSLSCPDLIVHIDDQEPINTPAMIYHKLKYITRATFRHQEWDTHMAQQLYGFKNSRWWGSWQDAPAWTLNESIEKEAMEIQAVSKLGSGICPDCGEPLKKWSKPVDSAHLVLWGAVEIGNTGYYRIPKQEFEGFELSPGARLRLEELQRSFRDKAVERAAEWAAYLESYDSRDIGIQGGLL